MNRIARRVLPALVIAVLGLVLLAACSSASKSSDAARASAAATSTAAQEAKQSATQIAARCVGTNPSATTLLALATSKADREALAAKCGIPASRRAAFKDATANSALAWGEAKGFDTKAGRDAWALGDTTLVTAKGAKLPSLPELIGEYSNG